MERLFNLVRPVNRSRCECTQAVLPTRETFFDRIKCFRTCDDFVLQMGSPSVQFVSRSRERGATEGNLTVDHPARRQIARSMPTCEKKKCF